MLLCVGLWKLTFTAEKDDLVGLTEPSSVQNMLKCHHIIATAIGYAHSSVLSCRHAEEGGLTMVLKWRALMLLMLQKSSPMK